MSELRRDCRWFLKYGSAPYCRRDAFSSPTAPLKKLDLGCDCDPEKDYQRQQWKADLYGDQDERGDAPRGEPPKIVEWEDET